MTLHDMRFDCIAGRLSLKRMGMLAHTALMKCAVACLAIMPMTSSADTPAPNSLKVTGVELQVTHEPRGHILSNCNVFSPDSRAIVYDVRSDPSGSQFDGSSIETVEITTGKVQTLYESKQNAKCGVVSFNPVRNQVAFILGPENPTADFNYGASRRQGVIVDLDHENAASNLDARDLSNPFTPGALRGGTHVHIWDAAGQWVSFTYEDQMLEAMHGESDAQLNQRNVGVSVPSHAVQVAADHPRNHGGEYFTVLVTRTVNHPAPGSDEIQKAFEESWIGRDGYQRTDGSRQKRALAFQGQVIDANGQPVNEVYVADLPDDLTIAGEGPLEGTSTARPFPPKGVTQRRITRTLDRKYPGIQGPRHWLKSSPDGSKIAFLMKDDAGVVQIFTVSPSGGPISQLTHNSKSIASAFTFSPDGKWIAHVMDNSVCVTDSATGDTQRLTARTDDAIAPRPEACVFSPDGKMIAFVRSVGSPSYNQVFVVKLQESTSMLKSFDLKDVRLLNGPFKENQDRAAEYLLKLEPDRLLAGFREEAGLKAKAARYGGWESAGVAGHCLGHYLSGCSQMFAATGDQRFKQRVDYVVSELAACQDANTNGYLAAFKNGKKIFAEVAAGEIRSKGFDLNGGWVPWYTIHKQMAGLRDAYLHTGNQQALEVWKKLSDWAIKTTDNLSDKQLSQMLRCEHGGINESAADLYSLTGDQRYLTLAKRFNDHVVLDPLSRGENNLPGLHANTQIPKVIGAAREYELTSENWGHDVATQFWNLVTTQQSYVIGGNSDGEHFGKPGKLSERLSNHTAETCNSYNMLKLTSHLFRWDASPAYADFYERVLFNHILASQEETGRVTYYMSLQPGTAKEYQSLFESFTCCVGTGMENHSHYGNAVYFHNDDSLWINLFIASELNWSEKGLKLKQDTRFPDGDKSRLTLSLKTPTTFILNIRQPAWATNGVNILVNGGTVDVKDAPGSYIQLNREWRDGDTIEVTMPMSLRIETTPDDPNKAAVCYGPVVLSADLGTSRELVQPLPVIVSDRLEISTWLKPVVGEPLTFKTSGVGRPDDLILVPFFRLHHRRGIVYFDFFTEDQWAKREADFRERQRQKADLEARTVDFFQPGEMQPERDHAFDGEKTNAGENQGVKWRDARDGGWFAFEMKTDPQQSNQLAVTYWGGDGGDRDFDLIVENQQIASISLTASKPNSFIDVVYDLPAKLIDGKSTITVKFRAHPGRTAGGIFGVRSVRAKQS